MTLPPLPKQPAGVPWPTGEWPNGDLSSANDWDSIDRAFDYAFGPDSAEEIGETHALLVIQGGCLLAELYAPGFDIDVTCRSWSMAKSITHALVGMAVLDGRIDIAAPAGVPEWTGPGDPRGAITLDQLLRMSSGVAFVEEYVPDAPSDVIEMLFGKGKEDVAAFAANFPLAHRPGGFFAYSSGTTNIVSGCLSRALGAKGDAFKAFMFERLFGPLGMDTADLRFDAAGTFIGSSFCYATPRDFARFGLLYLRDGVWDGRRLLPEGWVDYARTPTFQQSGGEVDGPYGAHWWLDIAGPGSFSANGYEGQYIVLVPDKDLILVRHGATPMALKDNLKAWMKDLAAAFG